MSVLGAFLAGISFQRYLDIIDKATGHLRPELVYFLTSLLAYCAVSVVFIINFVMSAKYRKKMSAVLKKRTIPMMRCVVIGILMFGIPHLIMFFLVVEINHELISAIFMLIFVIFSAIDGFDMSTRWLLCVCVGALLGVISLVFTPSSVNEPLALFMLFIAIVLVSIGSVLYKTSDLQSDALLSLVCSSMSGVVFSFIYAFYHLGTGGWLSEINLFKADIVLNIAIMSMFWMPVWMITFAESLSGDTLTKCGTSSLIQFAVTCIYWVINQYNRAAEWQLAMSIISATLVLSGSYYLLKEQRGEMYVQL